MQGWEWTDLLSRQEGKCAICQAERPVHPSRVWWHTDHYPAIEILHQVVVVRGILCPSCNNKLRFTNYRMPPLTGMKRVDMYLTHPLGGVYGKYLPKARRIPELSHLLNEERLGTLGELPPLPEWWTR